MTGQSEMLICFVFILPRQSKYAFLLASLRCVFMIFCGHFVRGEKNHRRICKEWSPSWNNKRYFKNQDIYFYKYELFLSNITASPGVRCQELVHLGDFINFVTSFVSVCTTYNKITWCPEMNLGNDSKLHFFSLSMGIWIYIKYTKFSSSFLFGTTLEAENDLKSCPSVSTCVEDWYVLWFGYLYYYVL